MFQWFIRFPEFTEFLFHSGKTQLNSLKISRQEKLKSDQNFLLAKRKTNMKTLLISDT